MRTFTFIPAVGLLLLCAIASDVSYAGMTKRMGKVEVTVNSYRFSFGSGFVQPDPGNVFLVIDVSVTNHRRKAIAVSSLLQTFVYDNKGYKYIAAINPDEKGSIDGEVPAGRMMRGEVSYEVPLYATGLEFAFDFTLLPGGEVRFPIGDSYGVMLKKQREQEEREHLRREQESRAQIRAHVDKGNQYFNSKEYKKAVEQYEAAIKMDRTVKADISDKIAKCYYLLGEQCFDQRYYRSARDYYLSAVEYDSSMKAKLRSNLAQCYLSIGDAYLGEGYFDKALQNYEVAKTTDYSLESKVASKVGKTYLAIGDAHFDKGDFHQALRNYKAAKNVDQSLESKVASKLGDIYLAIGKRFESEGRYGDALVLYENSLQYAPDNDEAKDRIGEINSMRKNPTLAGLLSIIPGVGQLSLGQPGKAIGYFGLAAASVGVSVAYLGKADSKYEEYEKATNSSDARRLHKETMDNYKISLRAAGIGACVIVYSMYDAYVGAVAYNQRFKPTSESGRYSINVMPILSEGGILLAAKIQF